MDSEAPGETHDPPMDLLVPVPAAAAAEDDEDELPSLNYLIGSTGGETKAHDKGSPASDHDVDMESLDPLDKMVRDMDKDVDIRRFSLSLLVSLWSGGLNELLLLLLLLIHQ